MRSRVAAVLMASGYSSRFGSENKLLAPFLDKPLAEHTLSLVCAMPDFADVYFVCADPAVCRLAEKYPVSILRNQNRQRGACESVRLGVAAAKTAQYYLFMPCDQPLLDRATLKTILKQREPGHIVTPAHAGRQGGPSLFCASFKEELLALRDGENPRLIKQRHPAAVKLAAVGDPLVLADADTPEALRALERLVPNR